MVGGVKPTRTAEVPITTRETVYFYYSVDNRYSYLASTQAEALEREAGCEVIWRALYSMALYEIHAHNPFKGEAISGQYDWDYPRYNAECWAPSMVTPTHQTTSIGRL